MARSLTSGLTVSRTPAWLERRRRAWRRWSRWPSGAASSTTSAERTASLRRPCGTRSLGSLRVKGERQVADLQPVAVGQRLPALDQPAVDERAVAAVQVLDEELAVLAHDLRVLPADRGGVEHDVAVGMPAQHGALAKEPKVLARPRRLQDLQDRHDLV